MRKSRDWEKKRKVYEEIEEIKGMGQENEEEAAKVVNHVYKRKEIEQMGKRTFFLEKLDSRRKYNDYTKVCAQITYYYLEEQDYPPFIKYTVKYDTKGVIMFVAIGPKMFQRAFRAVREPLYDLNACEVFAVSVGDLAQSPEKPNGQYNHNQP